MKAYSSTVRILATLLMVAATSCLGGEDSRIEQKGNEKGLVSFYVQNESETIKQVKIWAFLPDGKFHSETEGNLSPSGKASFSAKLTIGHFSLLVGVDADESVRLAYPEGLAPNVALTSMVSKVRAYINDNPIPASGGTPRMAVLRDCLITINSDYRIELKPWSEDE